MKFEEVLHEALKMVDNRKIEALNLAAKLKAKKKKERENKLKKQEL